MKSPFQEDGGWLVDDSEEIAANHTLGRTVLFHWLPTCNHLHTLDIAGYRLDDPSLYHLGHQLPQLQYLSLGYLFAVSAEGIEVFCRSALTTHLQGIELHCLRGELLPSDPSTIYFQRILTTFTVLTAVSVHLSEHKVEENYALAMFFLSREGVALAQRLVSLVYHRPTCDYKTFSRVYSNDASIWHPLYPKNEEMDFTVPVIPEPDPEQYHFLFSFPHLQSLTLCNFPLNSRILEQLLHTSPALQSLDIVYQHIRSYWSFSSQRYSALWDQVDFPRGYRDRALRRFTLEGLTMCTETLCRLLTGNPLLCELVVSKRSLHQVIQQLLREDPVLRWRDIRLIKHTHGHED